MPRVRIRAPPLLFLRYSDSAGHSSAMSRNDDEAENDTRCIMIRIKS